MRYPKELFDLIHHLKKFPGVGKKTAERFAFYLLENSSEELHELGHLISQIKNKIKHCNCCGLMLVDNRCFACDLPRPHPHLLCIVAHPKDALAIEESSVFSGRYHVLGSLLSPLDGKAPDQMRLTKLFDRLKEEKIDEIILALDSTLEGDATALFMKEQLLPFNISVTRPALGIPMGSSFDYVDEGTLMRSLTGRQKF